MVQNSLNPVPARVTTPVSSQQAERGDVTGVAHDDAFSVATEAPVAEASLVRPPSPRTLANHRVHAQAGSPPALGVSAEGLAELQAKDAQAGNPVAKLFAKQPHDAFTRERGVALTLREKFGEPLSAAEQHELTIIRVVRSIDAAQDSKAGIEASIAQQEQQMRDMPFMEAFLSSSVAMNREFASAQAQIITEQSAYLSHLLRRA